MLGHIAIVCHAVYNNVIILRLKTRQNGQCGQAKLNCWNFLPTEIRSIESTSLFKAKVKDH